MVVHSPLTPATLPAEVQRFAQGYGFPLDPFQLRAAAAVAEGRGVLVGAPTGAGKTVVGEFAVHMAFHNGGTCFYTTPIKALSNQKFHDLAARYGEANVGLLTGDVTINGDAPIVVMTTEVLRNMIYADSERLDALTHVVMDEVHFLADPSRGPVWEEAILNLNPRVILVSLSATVSNVEEFGGWLRTVRGETDIVITDTRPVPLRQFMMVGSRILPLFDGSQPSGTERGTDINRAVLAAAGRAEELGRRRGPKRTDVVFQMGAAGMLPAIYFIFSRVGCDAAVKQLLVDRVDLVTEDERSEILAIVDAGVADLSPEDLRVLGFHHWRRGLARGFGAHHAGMLPAFRHIVEKLFSRGLLKVCFATETLALGINMPARSVVLEKLVKFNGETHADLTPGQYTQLTGRAGRRGIDVVGNAVVLWSQGMDPYAVADLASTRTYPLDSTFRPGYNMAVNLIATKGLAESHRLLERSFAQYQANGTVVERAEAVQRRRRQLAEQRSHLEGVAQEHGADVESVLEYAQLRRALSQAERRARRESTDMQQGETVALLRSLAVGDVIALPTGRNPVTAVIARADNSPRNPRPVLITEDGWAERVSADIFGNTPVLIGHMRVHKGVERNPKRLARSVAANLRRMHFDKPAKLKSRARARASAILPAREQVQRHPLHTAPAREELARAGEQYLKAQRRLDFQEKDSTHTGDTLVGTFDRIVDLLVELEYLERREPSAAEGEIGVTLEGGRLARIHHESDLLVAQCLRRGLWDCLDPAELAAVVSTCVFENRGGGGPTATGASELPTPALAEAVGHTLRVHAELLSDEERHRIPLTRPPETAFATACHQWTAGASLDYCLNAAEASGASMTAGDFVRWCRRVIDLLDQIKQTGYSDEVRRSARKATAAIQRGVVSIEA